MKVFISQPMAERTEEGIRAERERIVTYAHSQWPQAEIIQSCFQDAPVSGNVPLKYLARSIELMADADVAIFAKDWHTARGCRIENACAHMYGIECIELSQL